MPAPLVIWGIIAGASALTSLGYAGYKAWDEHEQEEARANQAREAARKAQEEREEALRQVYYQQQMQALQKQVTKEMGALGLRVNSHLAAEKLLAWAELGNSDSTQPWQQHIASLLPTLSSAQLKTMVDLLVAMEDCIGPHAKQPLLAQLTELHQLSVHYQLLSALEEGLVSMTSK